MRQAVWALRYDNNLNFDFDMAMDFKDFFEIMEERGKEMDPEMGKKVSVCEEKDLFGSCNNRPIVGVRIKCTLSLKILFELILNMNHYFKNNNVHIFLECFRAFSKDPDGCITADEMK